jgi:2-C-methyl-D-erythritol 4-phosphate cytidylyltransferase
MRSGDVPKQYLPLAGKCVIEWAIAPFLTLGDCGSIVVALAADDSTFNTLHVAADGRVRTTVGGRERADSVRAGLLAITADAKEDDWVLVHDAARPCLSEQELSRLIDSLQSEPIGGLLGLPVVDTLKRADGERVQSTVPRTHLWRALTPQMFRFGLLRDAMERTRDQPITDEAQAIEALGLQARLVPGSEENIKITYPEDLARAARILDRRLQ